MYFPNRHYDIFFMALVFFFILQPYKLNSWQILIVTEKKQKEEKKMWKKKDRKREIT